MDRIDFQILAELQKNARISNKELAYSADLAPSSTHQRLKNLKDKGVIKGFHADLDLKSLGISLQAFIFVQLHRHIREDYKKLTYSLEQLPEVLSVYFVSGKYDLLVHVAVKDSDELKNLILDRFVAEEEIERCETSMIYDHAYVPSILEQRNSD